MTKDQLLLQTTQAWAVPGEIDLGVGQPQDSLLPTELLQRAAQKRLSSGDLYLLQYGTEYGDGYLRWVLAEFLTANYGCPVEPERLFITNGNSQALDMLCTFIAKPGDTVFVEEPSYFLAHGIFRDHHLNLVGIPMDENGIRVDALEEALTHHRPAFLYTIPAFQNPTGFTLSAERRKKLVELSQRHGFLIVADEVYQLLNYTVTPPKPFSAYVDSGSVLSLGTFSKILAPGLRLGWIHGAQSLVQRLADASYVISGGGLNPFTASLVRTIVEEGWQQEYLTHLRGVYGKRVVVMDAALRRYFPKNVMYRVPGGGYFFWLQFPDEVDTRSFLNKAEALKVGYRPGVKFSANDGMKNFMRLSFAFFGEEELSKGVELLARCIDNEG